MSPPLRVTNQQVNFWLTRRSTARGPPGGDGYSCRVTDVRLDPMTIDEFDERLPSLMHAYVAEQIRARNWASADADELAQLEQRRLLPRGLATPGMRWYVARTPSDQVVGYLWLATEPSDPRGGGAWIYAIEVEPEWRGRGVGHRLLSAAEVEVRRLGATSIALNVFGENRVARHLYESSGYEVTSLQMRKSLT